MPNSYIEFTRQELGKHEDVPDSSRHRELMRENEDYRGFILDEMNKYDSVNKEKSLDLIKEDLQAEEEDRTPDYEGVLKGEGQTEKPEKEEPEPIEGPEGPKKPEQEEQKQQEEPKEKVPDISDRAEFNREVYDVEAVSSKVSGTMSMEGPEINVPEGTGSEKMEFKSEEMREFEEEFDAWEKTKWVPARVLSAVIEKPSFAMGELAARGGKIAEEVIRKVTPLDDEPSDLMKDYVDFYAHPEEEGFVTPFAEKGRQVNRKAAFNKSYTTGILADLISTGTDVGAYWLGAGAFMSATNSSAAMLSSTDELGQMYNHIKNIGVHSFLTSPGGFQERAKGTIKKVGYNLTPYVTKMFPGATNVTAPMIDTGLNIGLSSPYYLKQMKEQGGLTKEFFAGALPMLATDIGFALRTRGNPEAVYKKKAQRYVKDNLPKEMPKEEKMNVMNDLRRVMKGEFDMVSRPESRNALWYTEKKGSKEGTFGLRLESSKKNAQEKGPTEGYERYTTAVDNPLIVTDMSHWAKVAKQNPINDKEFVRDYEAISNRADLEAKAQPKEDVMFNPRKLARTWKKEFGTEEFYDAVREAGFDGIYSPYAKKGEGDVGKVDYSSSQMYLIPTKKSAIKEESNVGTALHRIEKMVEGEGPKEVTWFGSKKGGIGFNKEKPKQLKLDKDGVDGNAYAYKVDVDAAVHLTGRSAAQDWKRIAYRLGDNKYQAQFKSIRENGQTPNLSRKGESSDINPDRMLSRMKSEHGMQAIEKAAAKEGYDGIVDFTNHSLRVFNKGDLTRGRVGDQKTERAGLEENPKAEKMGLNKFLDWKNETNQPITKDFDTEQKKIMNRLKGFFSRSSGDNPVSLKIENSLLEWSGKMNSASVIGKQQEELLTKMKDDLGITKQQEKQMLDWWEMPKEDRPGTLSPAQRDVMNKYSEMMDAGFKYAKKNGVINSYIENFVKHAYKGKQGQVTEMLSDMRAETSAAKKRKYLTRQAARDAGLKPVNDIGKLARMWTVSTYKAVAGKQFVKVLENAMSKEGVPAISNTKKEGYEEIKNESIAKEIEGVRGRSFFVHPDIASPLKALDKPGTVFGKAWQKSRNNIKRLLIHNPLWHTRNIFSEALIESNFNVVKSIKAVRNKTDKDLLFEKAGVDNMKELERMMARADVATWKANQAVREMVETTKEMGMYTGSATKIGEKFQGTKLGEWARTLKTMNDEFMWGKVVDGGQKFIFTHKYAKFLDQGMSKEEAAKAAGHYTNSVTGSLARTYFTGNQEKFMNWGLFSRNWTTSNLRLVTGALGAQGKKGQFRLPRFLEHKGLNDKQMGAVQKEYIKHLTKGMMGFYAFNTGVSMALTGIWGDSPQGPWTNEKGHKLEIRTPWFDNKGQRIYIQSPMYAFMEDIIGWGVEPAKTLMGKAEPLLKTSIETALNKSTWKGEIASPNAPFVEHWKKRGMYWLNGVTPLGTYGGSSEKVQRLGESLMPLFSSWATTGTRGGELQRKYFESKGRFQYKEGKEMKKLMKYFQLGDNYGAVRYFLEESPMKDPESFIDRANMYDSPSAFHWQYDSYEHKQKFLFEELEPKERKEYVMTLLEDNEAIKGFTEKDKALLAEAYRSARREGDLESDSDDESIVNKLGDFIGKGVEMLGKTDKFNPFINKGKPSKEGMKEKTGE